MPTAKIYTAPQCPHSKKLKQYLDEEGISYEEKCILTDPETVEEIFELTKQKAVPVTVLGDDFFIGFDRRTQRRIKRKMRD
jgi:glutaredoxin